MSNVVKWINEKIINDGTSKIDTNDIDEIRDFALLWNLFEDLLCSNNANMSKIDTLIDSKIDKFNELEYQDTFQYFYNRYKSNDEKFNALRLRDPQKNLVKKVLNDEFTDKNNKLKFIMAVIYRFRNNLFHGEKNMRYISLQKENFEKANIFLMYFIDTCRSN